MALTWYLTLKDQFSGAAKTAAASAEKLQDKLKATDRAAKQLDASMKTLAKSTAIKHGEAMRRLDAALEAKNRGRGVFADGRGLGPGAVRLSDSARAMQMVSRVFGPGVVRVIGHGAEAIERYGPALGKIASVGAGAAASIAAIAAAAGMAAGALAIKGAAMVRDAQAFRESTLFAFQKILGSKQEAQRVFDMAAKTTLELGLDFREGMSAMTTLLAQGFKADFADELIRRMADLKAVNPMANMEAITRAMMQIKATGRLQGDELMQLNEAGLSTVKVYEHIAKRLGIVAKNGKSATEIVQEMQRGGKIKADTAIAAIMDAIKEQTGGGAAGSVAAEKASKSLEGVWQQAKNLKDQLLGSVRVDWSPAISAIKKLMGAMQSPAGQKFLKTIGDTLTGLLDNAFGRMSQADIEKLFIGGAAAVEKFGKVAAQVIDVLQAIWGFWDKLSTTVDRFAGSGTTAAVALDMLMIPMRLATEVLQIIVGIFEACTGAIESFEGAMNKASSSTDVLSAAGQKLGAALSSGFVSGILSSLGSVGDAAKILGDTAIGKLKAATETFSPSRAAMRVGRAQPQGLAIGIRQDTPRAEEAAVDMAMRVRRAGEQLGRSVTNISNVNNSRNVNIGTINATGGGGGPSAKTQIGNVFRDLAMSYS